MKKIYKFIIVILSLTLTSCGFVNYVEQSSSMEQSLIDELATKRHELINKLEELYHETDYEETERRIFIKTILEAKTELLECVDVDYLKQIYDEYVVIIGNIKTKKQYAKELSDKKDKYIEMINSISNEGAYRDAEKNIYYFYIESATDTINSLSSVNEDFDKVFLTYKEIIESIKTDEDYLIEEANAFKAYKLKAINEINGYVSLTDYREEEASAIRLLIDATSKRINESTEYDEVDSFVREYKTEVYQYKTDSQLYDQELKMLINESVNTLENSVNFANYRDNEIAIIKNLFNSFEEESINLSIKEEVASLLDTYVDIISSIKTDSQLYEDEKQLLVDDLFEQLKVLVDFDNLSVEQKQYYDDAYLALKAVTKKHLVQKRVNEEKIKLYEAGAISGDSDCLKKYQLCVIDGLSYYLDKALYRREQQLEIESIIESNYYTVLSCPSYSSTNDAISLIETQLDNVLTNDEMWKIEDLEFANTLHSLFGDEILIPEGSLTEANNYYELANIIDYYAFYQLEANTFIRDTFRVKLNWDHRDSTFEKREAYWYCELICRVVGIDFYFEDGDYLVVKLIPYDMCSIDVVDHTDKYENVTEFVSNSTLINRADDFDDFSYKNNTNKVICWNSQQLWYALEHNYVPDCIPGSKAESVFNEAKNILRHIIKEGMSDIQKIYEIYKWCGDNWHHDYDYLNHKETSDPNEYPDENFALLSTTYAEGGIFNKTVVCHSAAKAFIIFLKIEGMEAYKVLGKNPGIAWVNTINECLYGFGGTHDVIFVHLGDTWYYCDPLGATRDSNHNVASLLRMLIPNTDIEWQNRKWTELRIKTNFDKSIYSNIQYDGKSIYVDNDNNFKELVDSFLNKGKTGQCLTVLFNSEEYDALDYYKNNYNKEYYITSWEHLYQLSIYL